MSSESALSYNGPLSTYREWHVFAFGLVAGVILALKRVRSQLRREPGTFVAGCLVGFVATLVALEG
jgi:hypothetical protein